MEPPNAADDRDRQVMVGDVVADVLRRRASGEAIADGDILEVYPELMPELAEAMLALDENFATLIEDENAETMLALDGEDSAPFRAIPQDKVCPISVAGYTLRQEVSRGGQGVVYEAIQDSTGQRVALKVVHRALVGAERQKQRLDREVHILATLQHPNIVSILDRGTTKEGLEYFAMPFIDGLSLDKWLTAYREEHEAIELAQNPGEILTLFRTICEAVHVAHKAGIVHRDLKPSNIRIDRHNLPHILDFGIARDDTSFRVTPESPLTLTGQFLGSLAWASPEQAEGKPELIDARTDVYALGVILYQALTGEFPYEVVGNMRDVLDNIMRVEPTPPSKIIASQYAKLEQDARVWREQHPDVLNNQLEGILLKSLAKLQKDRYENAGALAADISRYLAGQKPVADAHVPAAPPASKIPLIILTAAIVAMGVFVVINQQEPASPEPPPAVAVLPPKPVVAPTPTPPPAPVVEPEPEPAPEPIPVPEPQPDAEPWPTRVASQRIIEIGGSVILTEGGKVGSADGLPQGDFKVHTIHVSENKEFTDKECALLAGLPSLSRLYFRNTSITNAGIVHLKDCSSITMMDLLRTDITDEGMAAFAGMSNLSQLEMDGCMISDEGLYHLRNHSSLNSLRCSGALIGDEGLEYIKSNHRLSSLVAGGTRITDKGLATIAANFPRMSFLTLGSTGVSDAGMPELAKLKGLSYLHLDGTALSDAGMPYIGKLEGLKQLSIYATRITDAGLEHLKGLKLLNYVDVSHTKVTPEGVAALKAALPNANIYRR